jgi:DNA-binding CsgD family transcriptional regulator
MQSPDLRRFKDAEVMLELLALGFDGTEISTYLGIQKDTFRGRIERLKNRFGARNLTHLVYQALDAEIIEPIPLWAPFVLSPVEIEIIELVATGHTKMEISKKVHVTENAILKRLLTAKDRNGAFTTHHLIAMWYSEEVYPWEHLNNLSVWGSSQTTDLRVNGFALFS